MKRITFVALALITAASCSGSKEELTDERLNQVSSDIRDQAARDPIPVPDLRSPDTVVKSYWQLQDWMERHGWSVFRGMKINEEVRQYFQASISLAANEYRSTLEADFKEYQDFGRPKKPKSFPVYQRDIIEIKNETETRAVVLAKVKNITPIPPGRKLAEMWNDDREYGIDVRYIVEKTPEGWRLSQAWSRDSTDIDLDEFKDKKTGGWKKHWSAPLPESDDQDPGDFHYVSVSP